MTQQLALSFDPRKLARRDDAKTSKDAAANAVTFRAGHEAKIFSAIVDADYRGATMHEIADLTGLTPVQVARRLSAMGERKLIERRLKEAPDGPGDWRERGRAAIWWKT